MYRVLIRMIVDIRLYVSGACLTGATVRGLAIRII